jgi:hypothetical protein
MNLSGKWNWSAKLYYLRSFLLLQLHNKIVRSNVKERRVVKERRSPIKAEGIKSRTK